MFSRLMPREGKYFDFFNQHAQLILAGSKELVAMMDAFWSAPDKVPQHIARIGEIESQADRITRDVMKMLHKSFVTPLDRNEIHALMMAMDDVIDLIEDAAEVIALYDLSSVTPEMRSLAVTTLSCVERVKAIVGMLSSMDNGPAILTLCHEIDELESEADALMRAGMSKLFRDEPDVRQVLKMKAVYEILESVSDACEDVANIAEGIVLENS